MVAVGPEELLQLVIGPGQISDMRAVKQAWPVAVGDLSDVGQHGGKSRRAAVLVPRHGTEQGSESPPDAVGIEAWGMAQNLGDALDPVIRRPHHGPKGSGLL
jgi:hypothetical protein